MIVWFVALVAYQTSESEMIKWPNVIALLVGVGFIGIVAVIGTTILGVVAINQIRYSAGKLYGLPLAIFDALLFPMLLLDYLILVVVAAVTLMVLVLLGGPNGPLGKAMEVLPQALTLGIGLPIIAWVDYRIVRAVWRKVSEKVSGPAL